MDLADKIDDYICSFEGLGDLTMDSLAMFIFIWAIFTLFTLWLCKFLYKKHINKQDPSSEINNAQNIELTTTNDIKTERRLSEPKDLFVSKSETKELGTKAMTGYGERVPTSASPGNAIGCTGAGQVKRRVVRQSSTGPENRKKRYVPPPSNVVGPETSSVSWTSQVFRWLYSDLVIVNELLMSWVIALNDSLRKSVEEHGVAVEIVRVLPDSPAPGLNNIFCNCDEQAPSDMLITFDCDAMPVLQVKSFRQKNGKVETSHYKVTVSRFRARMAIPMNYNTLKGEMRVEGYPDVRIAMNSVGAIKSMDQDEQQLQTVISELLTNVLRETVYPVDFSMYSTCPRAEVSPLELPHTTDQLSVSNREQFVSARRLLVTIVKADGLINAINPYVVIEMDEPAQKNQTVSKKGSAPYWDEHFLFELSPQSAEILFEVYDLPTNAKDPPKFIGLGLVGIDELAVGSTSTQLLTLQPRPYEIQQVYGSITVDFLFIEGAEIPTGSRAYKIKEALRIGTPSLNEQIKSGADLANVAVRALQDGALNTNGQPSKSTLIIHSVQRNQNSLKVDFNEIRKMGDALNNAPTMLNTSDYSAQSESDFMHSYANETLSSWNETDSGMPNKNCVSSSLAQSEILNELLENSTGNNESNIVGDITSGEFDQPIASSSLNGSFNNDNNDYQRNITDGSNNNYFSNNSLARKGVLYSATNINFANAAAAPTTHPIDADVDERSRCKKRNFFGTLKKRLSRSKTRTLSVDQNVLMLNNSNNNDINISTSTKILKNTKATSNINGESSRSLSVDRATLSKCNSFGPRMGIQSTLDYSRRSSISESSAISGFSSASNKTYIHEASTLVLETVENGVKRHFVVPHNIAQRPKWRRKGTKLHIYNDHTFIAKHLSGSGLLCSICMKSIPRRPGKQGYECRDCKLICHKQCHIRAPQACPNATVLSIELTKLNTLIADKSIRKL